MTQQPRLLGFADTPKGTTVTITQHDNTDTVEVVETRTTDVPEEAAHIIYVPENDKGITAHSIVLEARINGTPVKAVCGYEWVPTRDPSPLPVCEACLEFYKTRGSDLGDRGDKPDA